MSTDSPFNLLKPTCVALLGQSLLTPQSTPTTSKLLSTLLDTLQTTSSLPPQLIEYVFFPLSTILRRNPMGSISDQLVEKLFAIIAVLVDHWWWDCSLQVWDQIFTLCASILNGMDLASSVNQSKGKQRQRDDETIHAAVLCLRNLVRPRTPEETPSTSNGADMRRMEIVMHAQAPSFFPVIGQAVSALLTHSKSRSKPLQQESLHVLHLLIEEYIPSGRILSVFPGVVSTTCRVALGENASKGWQTGDVVKSALDVLQLAIIKSIGDDICIQDGVLRSPISDLEDVINILSPTPRATGAKHSPSTSTATTPAPDVPDPFSEARTSSWLNATSSQVHLAINTLSRLVNHPTPSAQLALCALSATILQHASLTLPTLHNLLLSHLLTFSLSSFPSIANKAEKSLIILLSDHKHDRLSLGSTNFVTTTLHLTSTHLSSLPRSILSHSDAKVIHSCHQIKAICKMVETHPDLSPSLFSGLSKLLGPSGGIEKWGTSLLAVVELHPPTSESTTFANPVGLLLDSLGTKRLEVDSYPFPLLTLKHISDTECQTALEEMLAGLGRIGGVDALYAVEWFVGNATDRGSRQIAALWCATRILEGIGRVSLSSPIEAPPQVVEFLSSAERKRLDKAARWIVRAISDFWELEYDDTSARPLNKSNVDVEPEGALSILGDSQLPTEHFKGVTRHLPNLELFLKPETQSSPKVGNSRQATTKKQLSILHRAVSLHLLSISASVLTSLFPPLFLYCLYPLLRSLVSSSRFLSNTALAALHHITQVAAYASPSNLLLSNFDYALDGVSRRLLPGQLDLKATSVLVVLVRLVGRDVVRRAGDLVQECFDRLDEFHGYGVVVAGLVSVLGEVVEAVDERVDLPVAPNPVNPGGAKSGLDEFLDWYDHRHDKSADENEDFGPAPHQPWDTLKQDDTQPQEQLRQPDDDGETPLTPTQELISQIMSRSLPFLTHSSPSIRSHILGLIRSSIGKTPTASLQPSIHKAWPFILNRLADSDMLVATQATELIGKLLQPNDSDSNGGGAGSLMASKLEDDIWPAFKRILAKSEGGENTRTLVKPTHSKRITPQFTQYTAPHRLHLAILRALCSVFRPAKDPALEMIVKEQTTWEITLKCRRFLSPLLAFDKGEIQAAARELYINLRRKNEDVVWLVLGSTAPGGMAEEQVPWLTFLEEPKWHIEENVGLVTSSNLSQE